MEEKMVTERAVIDSVRDNYCLRKALDRLMEVPHLAGHNKIFAVRSFDRHDYKIVFGKPPEDYDESYSSICWGWLITAGVPVTYVFSGNVYWVMASMGNGERGDEPYDERCQGLVFWVYMV